jgi:hypothetical protein
VEFFSDQQVYTLNVFDQPRNLNRLNRRFEHVIRPNLAHIRGKRVLDLGSHDGHWCWAALECGAEYVLGVEGRRELVERSHDIFSARQIDPARYDFVRGDVHAALAEIEGRFDTILCLGLFYHILDHHRLMQLMGALRPEAIVLDTMVVPDDNAFIQLLREDPAKPINAIPRSDGQRETAVGWPSRGALTVLAAEIGYTVEVIPWNFERIVDHTNITDYRDGTRLTTVLRPAKGG